MAPRLPDDVRATFALMLMDRRVNPDNREDVYHCMAQNFDEGRFTVSEIRKIVEDDVEKYLTSIKSRSEELIEFIKKGKATNKYNGAMAKRFGDGDAPLLTLKLTRTERPVAKGASKYDPEELTDNSSDDKDTNADRKHHVVKRKRVKDGSSKASVDSRPSPPQRPLAQEPVVQDVPKVPDVVEETRTTGAEVFAEESQTATGGGEMMEVDNEVEEVTEVIETTHEPISSQQNQTVYEEVEIEIDDDDDDVMVVGQDPNSEDIPDYGPPPAVNPDNNRVSLITAQLMKRFNCSKDVAETACVASSAEYNNACHWIQTFTDSERVIENGLYFYQEEDAKLQAVQNDVTSDPELMARYGEERLKSRLRFLSENDFI